MKYFLLAQLPTGQAITFDEVDVIIRFIAGKLIELSLIIGIIMIVISGVIYMTAGDSSEKVKKAIGTFRNAVIGVAIVFAVGIIIDTIALAVTRGTPCRFGVIIPFVGTLCF